MAVLPSFGLTFDNEQGLQLGQHFDGLGGQVVAFLWVGGEVVQFKDGPGPRCQGLGGWITWGVTVVELPDLWRATGAGGEWGDHQQVRGGTSLWVSWMTGAAPSLAWPGLDSPA